MVNPILGDAGEWVSRVLKDQVFGVFKMFSLNWLFGSWTVDFASEILSFSSKCLNVVVLLHFEKAEFALEGTRHCFDACGIEEVKLNAFCDMHETPWYGM